MKAAEISREDQRKSKLMRGLAVLNSFRAGDTELTLSDLARRTALPKPTVHRLIKELVAEGFLEREGQGLRLGHSLVMLGARVPQHRILRRVALPRMRRLQNSVGASIYLVLRDGGSVTPLASVHSPSLPSAGRGERRMVCSRAVRRALDRACGHNGGSDRNLPQPEGNGLASVCVPVTHQLDTPAAMLAVIGPRDGLSPTASRQAWDTAHAICRDLQRVM